MERKKKIKRGFFFWNQLKGLKALKFAMELGHNSIILEGDSKIAIEAMQSGFPTLADYGHLIEEVKILAKSFAAIEFSFVPR